MKVRYCLPGVLLLLPLDVQALSLENFAIDTDLAPALRIFGLMTLLSLAPVLIMMLTAFTRIIVVLSLLRHALGLQQTPSNTVLISLTLFLTLFTMMPTARVVYTEAFIPFEKQEISLETALNKGFQPLKKFMIRQTREKDLALMHTLSEAEFPKKMEDAKIHQLIPAFMLSELQTAFQIGFMIFLPFLLIDLIVSGVLMTMGMMMVPPASIALPVKILLFVLIDGWHLVVQALVGSFK